MLEELFSSISPKALGILILGSFVVFKLIKWLSAELRIRALGGHAPRIRSYLPGGIKIGFGSDFTKANNI